MRDDFRSRNSFDNFEKRFRAKEDSFDSMFRFFPVLFVIVFCAILGWWIFVGYGVYQLVTSSPEGIGQAIGQVLKGVEEGRK